MVIVLEVWQRTSDSESFERNDSVVLGLPGALLVLAPNTSTPVHVGIWKILEESYHS